MNRLSKDDLSQMSRDYFQSLDKEKLVEVAGNLHAFAVEQLERLEQNSSNSFKPPSSDSPFVQEAVEFDSAKTLSANTDAFIGWLVIDGYGAYSSYEKRQHCLAHLNNS
jgi:transposase